MIITRYINDLLNRPFENQNPNPKYRSHYDTALIYLKTMSKDELKSLKKEINKLLRAKIKFEFNKSPTKKLLFKFFPWLIVTFAGYMFNELFEWFFSINIISVVKAYLTQIF